MLNILLLCDRQWFNAMNLMADIDEIARCSSNKVRVFSHRGNLPDDLDLSRFDVILIHNTSNLANDVFISPQARERLSQFKGLKVLFAQDTFTNLWMTKTKAQEIGVHLWFSVIDQRDFEKVYAKDTMGDIRVESRLITYFYDRLLQRKTKPISERPIDIGYRTRKAPLWCGRVMHEKWRLADWILEATKNSSLRVNVSYKEELRIYGREWFSFVEASKTQWGTESEAEFCDIDGSIKKAVQNHLEQNPDVTFDELETLYMKNPKVPTKPLLSPRCFEAIALKTALVLLEGEHGGILKPNVHYIELKKDLSNMDDVLKKILDTDFLQKMTDKAHEDFALNENYHYKKFVKLLDQTIHEEFEKRHCVASTRPYDDLTWFMIWFRYSLAQKLSRSRIVFGRLWRKLKRAVLFEFSNEGL